MEPLPRHDRPDDPKPRHTVIIAGCCLLLAGVSPGVALGQRQLSITAGAARIHQAGLPDSEALTLASNLKLDGRRTSLLSSAVAAFAGSSDWTALGLVSGSLYAPNDRRTRWELGGTLTAFDGARIASAASGTAYARQHLLGVNWGAWLGASAGGTARRGRRLPALGVEAGAWTTRGATRVATVAALSTLRTDTLWLYPDGFERLAVRGLSLADALAVGEWTVGRTKFDLSAGLRHRSDDGRVATPYASVGATIELVPHLALAVGVGRQPSEPLRGTPDVRFASIALQLSRSAGAVAPRSRPDTLSTRVVVTKRSEGQRALRVIAVRATRVELMADFTDWRPVVLTQRGGGWEADLSIASGTYRVLIRIDDGPWAPPANLPKVADDFGGESGLLVVP